MKKQRRHLNVRELYKSWASYYDRDPNLAIFLEEKITRPIFKNFKGKDILDYGCGTGRYCIELAENNNVTAVDLSKEMLEKAKEKAEKRKVKIDFQLSDITKFKSNKKFDIIISMLVLDHIKNLSKVGDIIGNISKKGTELFISNVPPYQIYNRKIILKKKKPINQNYHPLEEYLKLLRKKGFELIFHKELIFEEKYKAKRFKKLFNQLNEPVVVLMHFKRAR